MMNDFIFNFFNILGFKKNYFGCAGSLLLRPAFSNCGEQGLLFIVVHRLLIVVASLVVERGL